MCDTNITVVTRWNPSLFDTNNKLSSLDYYYYALLLLIYISDLNDDIISNVLKFADDKKCL